MARRWARVRPHRLSCLRGGDDPENRLVEEIPAEGFGGRRRAVHVFRFQQRYLPPVRETEIRSDRSQGDQPSGE